MPIALHKVLFTLLLAALAPLLVSCKPSEDHTYRGYLYFIQGSYLMRFSLRDSGLEAVVHLGDRKIKEISGFGENRLLIAETATINRRNVARISWLDLKTGRVRAMYSGVKARYIASADAIVYDDGSRLYSVTQADGTETTSEILSHKRHQLSAMIEVSKGRLLIETREGGVSAVHSYQAEDGSLITLERLARVCVLKGAVWIDDLELLVCKERTREQNGVSQGYIFADLDGRIFSRPTLPEGEKFTALAYIADQGGLVLKESWRSRIDGQEKSVVWILDVHSGESREISDSVNLGSSAVYAGLHRSAQDSVVSFDE